MAYVKATFNDLLLSFSFRYGETSVPPSGIDNRKYWINKGVDYCLGQLKLNKTVSVTVVDGECDLSSTSAGVAKDFRHFNKLGVYSLGGSVYITGDYGSGYILHAPDGTYDLNYGFYATPLVDGTDECIIPDPEAVVAYAYAQIRLSETDPLQDAQKNLQECDMRIKNMNQDIAKNEPDLTFKSLY